MDAIFLFQRCTSIYKKNAHLLSAVLKDENGRFKKIDLGKNLNAPTVMFQNDLLSYDLAKLALRCCASGKLGDVICDVSSSCDSSSNNFSSC